LAACGIAEKVLRQEWEKQVAVQTTPIKRTLRFRSSHATVLISYTGRLKAQGMATVEEVLTSRKKATLLFNRVAELEESLQQEDCTPEVQLYVETHIDDARKAWKKEQARATRLQQTLGIQDMTALRKLTHSDYYCPCMNAKSLNERLRAKLRDRKFKLDPIERSFRRMTSGTRSPRSF
jgi:hypothetical protein